MIMKGIKAKDIHSYYNMHLQLASRKINPPSLKRITDTVPFMNGEYDFSNINGEIALEPRELYYEFDIVKTFVQDREKIQRKFLWWVYQIIDTDIYDDYIEDYYFHGSLKNISYNEDWEKSTIGITFLVDPYMYAKKLSYVEFEVENMRNIELFSKSAHKIIPVIETTSDFVIEFDDKVFSINDRKVQSDDFELNPGINKMIIRGNGKIKISYREEVL